VRVLRQANAGPAAARNHGIRATSAPWIAFVDADDLWAPEKLARQAAEITNAADAEIVACCTDAWLLRDGRRTTRRLASHVPPARFALTTLLAGNPVVASSVVVRRDALVAAGIFDEDPVLVATEDYDLWLRLIDHGVFAYVDEPLVDYRVHAASLSSPSRFVGGLDRIFTKLAATHPDDLVVEAAGRRRRAQARLDAAYASIRAGDGATARQWLRRARELCASRRAIARLWLRSWVPFRGRD
jgi:glycosyltransferase involved in cell wall biosynthesis